MLLMDVKITIKYKFIRRLKGWDYKENTFYFPYLTERKIYIHI